MTGFSIPMLRTTSLALLCVASLAAVQPVRAQIHAHVRAGKSPRGSAISAGYTNASNGTVQHQGGRILHGANGASYAGHNSFSRNADGSASSSHAGSGTTAAGGQFSTSGAYTRSASGAISGSSQTQCS